MGINIINGPFDVWAAPVGEAFPEADAVPAGKWSKIGTNGSREYDEEGVIIEGTQELEIHRGAGGTEILKVSRTEEDLIVNFTLFDLASGEMVKAFNLAVTTTDTAAASGVGGYQSFSLLRGLTVTSLAILIRGENKSTDLATENIQYEIPEAIQKANLEMVAAKGPHMGLKFELMAIGNYTYAGTGSAGDFPYGLIKIGDTVAL